VTSAVAAGADELLAGARRALRAGDGPVALDALGWWDLLADLDDEEHRTAACALFRAQGRELATTPALGGLVAQPYLDVVGGEPGSLVAAVPRHSARRGTVHVLVGGTGGRPILVDRPGRGTWVVDADAVTLRPIAVPGRLELHEVELDPGARAPTITDDAARGARERATWLGRVAVALEMLGAAEATVDLALQHAGDREQFAQPIGRFQAVRHLLAWASTDCVALDGATREAVRLDRSAPPRFADVVKALAGRNGRRICERSLQVLGAIGFTAEHEHHHAHGRVLALDALLGTSAQLTHELGSWLRTGGDPGYPAAILGTGGG
jgi:hypothetical protein